MSDSRDRAALCTAREELSSPPGRRDGCLQEMVPVLGTVSSWPCRPRGRVSRGRETSNREGWVGTPGRWE